MLHPTDSATRPTRTANQGGTFTFFQNMHDNELSKGVSQDNRGAHDGRIEEIIDWLRRSYQASSAERNGHELPPSLHGITLRISRL